MEINYKTVATNKSPIVLQGVNVYLSAEYENNNIPGNVTFHCEGNYVESPSQQSVYLNFSGSYDCENHVFQSINGAGLLSDFLPGLEEKITEFYNTIKGA